MLNAVIVTIDVKPEFRERFIEESLLDAKGSVGTEPGCARFDIVQDRTDPNRFYLYEVYHDAAAEVAHLDTPHFKRWDVATRDWLARPFTWVSGITLHPPDEAW